MHALVAQIAVGGYHFCEVEIYVVLYSSSRYGLFYIDARSIRGYCLDIFRFYMRSLCWYRAL